MVLKHSRMPRGCFFIGFLKAGKGIRLIDTFTQNLGDPMVNRMLWRFVSAIALMAVAANAKVCEEGVLYSGINTPGQMNRSVSTFPEAPEWVANWGDLGNMKAPYIRLSGMKNVKNDWIGAFEFKALPMKVDGGSLRLKVRSTQKVNLGVWLSSSNGSGGVVFNNVPANSTRSLEIPVEKLLGNGTHQVEKVWLGLFDVPAYQYTTLFIDDVAFSCLASVKASVAEEKSEEYVSTKTDPASPVREPYFVSTSVGPTSAAYSNEERAKMADSTKEMFVLDLLDHMQIRASLSVEESSPSVSRRQWYRNMYLVDRCRLRDSVIANGKAVFDEASAFAAAADFAVMPLLVADVDYAYRACQDTSCMTTKLMNARLMQAGLPSSFVRGSKLRLVYDPYFTVMQKRNLPSVEVCVSGKCEKMAPGGMADFEFESAGVQKISVTLSSEGKTQRQNLFVEVK